MQKEAVVNVNRTSHGRDAFPNYCSSNTITLGTCLKQNFPDEGMFPHVTDFYVRYALLSWCFGATGFMAGCPS